MSGDRTRRAGCRSGQVADPALLAGRYRTADYLGLVVTRGPGKPRQNLGIYRQQVIGPNKVIMRWLAHRGGALIFASTRG